MNQVTNKIEILDTLLSKEPTMPNIILPGVELYAGSTAVFCAGPNVGKTWLALELALKVATGEPFYWEAEERSRLPGHDIEVHKVGKRAPKHILHIDLESGLDETVSKLDRMTNYLIQEAKNAEGVGIRDLVNNYYHYCKPGQFPKYTHETRQAFMDTLTEAIKRPYESIDKDSTQRAKIVFIDHLSALNGGDENNNSDMAALCNTIRIVAQDTQTVIIVLHHTTKASNRAGATIDINSIRGAGSIAACFTAGFFLTNEGDFFKVHQIKKAYYSPVYDLSFRLVDVRGSREYELKYRNKSYGLAFKSAGGLVKVREEKGVGENDILFALVEEKNTSQLKDALREAGRGVDNTRIVALLKTLTTAGRVVSKPGPKNSTIYALANDSWAEVKQGEAAE